PVVERLATVRRRITKRGRKRNARNPVFCAPMLETILRGIQVPTLSLHAWMSSHYLLPQLRIHLIARADDGDGETRPRGSDRPLQFAEKLLAVLPGLLP